MRGRVYLYCVWVLTRAARVVPGAGHGAVVHPPHAGGPLRQEEEEVVPAAHRLPGAAPGVVGPCREGEGVLQIQKGSA